MAKATRVASRQARAVEELTTAMQKLAADVRRIERKLDALAQAVEALKGEEE